MSQLNFTCKACGEEHDVAELSLGTTAPDQWSKLSDAEQQASELNDDLCIIEASEETHYFIRGCLEIPVLEAAAPFIWGVWCSLSKVSLQEMAANWESPERTELGPYFGWLCTRVPHYHDSMFLKTNVIMREVGLRPLVELQESDHPLAVHQRTGIGITELQELVTRVLHN